MSTETTERNINGILRYLRQYLDLRFAHAGRLNPKFLPIQADLTWHELRSIGRVLRKTKPFADLRIAVADILVSFDAEKKRSLTYAKSQSQIMNEIVTIYEQKDQVKTGLLAIRDLRALYHTIDPFLLNVIELIQTWIWWDLLDAADAFLFDCQVERIHSLQNGAVNERVVTYYRQFISKPPAQPEIGAADILQFEFYRTEDVVHGVERRREAEGDQQGIIALEPKDDRYAEAQVVQLGQHIRVADALRDSEEIDPALREYFGKQLHCAPNQVEHAKALRLELELLGRAKQQLSEVLHSSIASGTPYDFKERQLETLKERLEELREEIKPQPRVKESASTLSGQASEAASEEAAPSAGPRW